MMMAGAMHPPFSLFLSAEKEKTGRARSKREKDFLPLRECVPFIGAAEETCCVDAGTFFSSRASRMAGAVGDGPSSASPGTFGRLPVGPGPLTGPSSSITGCFQENTLQGR